MSGPFTDYTSVLKILKGYQARTPSSESQIRWIRGHAFDYGCRSSDVPEMVNTLIAKITPLAIAERLKN